MKAVFPLCFVSLKLLIRMIHRMLSNRFDCRSEWRNVELCLYIEKSCRSCLGSTFVRKDCISLWRVVKVRCPFGADSEILRVIYIITNICKKCFLNFSRNSF